MAIGTWEDFTSKWGFEDGASSESRDYTARRRLVKALNARPETVAANVRFLEFDRSGCHNACMILIASCEYTSEGKPVKTDKALLDMLTSEPYVPEGECPDALDGCVLNDMIQEAYYPTRKPRQPRKPKVETDFTT